MSGWKWLCLAEAITIALVWLLLGGTEPEAVQEESRNTPSVQPAAAPALSSSAGNRVAGQNPAKPESSASRPPGPHPWSSNVEGITLLVTVVDEFNAPVFEASGNHQQAGDEQAQPFSLRNDHRLLVTNLRAGRIQFNLRANGFLPFQQEFLVPPEPSIQRQTLRLERARRVLLYLRTSKGELLDDWAQRELERSTSDQPISAQLLREPASGNRPAKAMRPRGNELGDFIAHWWREQELPRDCSGAFDLRAEPPLHASAWLGRLYLGSSVVEAGAKEVVIVVDEAAVLRNLASLRMRVVDAATGEALPSAEAQLGFAWGGGSSPSSRKDGVIQFERVVPENRALTIRLKGYADTYRELQLDPGIALDLGDVPLSRPGHIRARLLGPDGTPLGKEMYRIFPTGSWTRPEEPEPMSTRTDADGWIDFQAGNERHQAIFGGGRHGLQAVVWEHGSASSEDLEIRLVPGAEVRILAVAPEGQSRLIWLLDAEGRLLSNSRQALSVAWSEQLSAGSYLLRVEDLDRNLLGTLDLRVPEGGGDLEVALP